MENNFTDEDLKTCFKQHLIYRNTEDTYFRKQREYARTNLLYEWPHETILYCCMSDPFESVKYKNNGKQHAEILLLKNLHSQFVGEKAKIMFAGLDLRDASTGSEDDVQELYDNGTEVTISITQNYSPCGVCAKEIIEFIKKCKVMYNYEIKMCISVGTFYYFNVYEEDLINLLVAGVQLQLIEDDLRNKIKALVTDGLDDFLELSEMNEFFNKREKWDHHINKEIHKKACKE